ncbi:hypothetical protein NP493_92g03000 [Ridgeia piscesae]|uniref:Chitin-binding type-2 domain-containing protein n=1 Tax=Ridgeia piscesae TaxID=27915 RepID=A0AAD9P8M7_RIDPI|nr:hypothetical protein NP493_92g03000 [Ridgeia piscesae]
MNKLFVAVLVACVVSAVTASRLCPTGPCAVLNCEGRPDGLYQHCTSCKKYIRCHRGRCIEECCPRDKVWDDNEKCCDWWSYTCSWDPNNIFRG